MPVVMDADRIGRTLTRIAHEVVERNKGVGGLAIVGVRTRGVHIARRLATSLMEIAGEEVPTGSLDITLYRDDLMRHAVGPQPLVRRTEIPFSIDDRKILLVDDVLYTGRTVRAARSSTSAGHDPFSWSSWWIADTGSCRSRPTTSARTCPPRSRRACRSGFRKATGLTRW